MLGGITLGEIREMSDKDLINRFDDNVVFTTLKNNPNVYLDELKRREQERANAKMLEHTEAIKTMTGIITFLTIMNVIVVGVTIFK